MSRNPPEFRGQIIYNLNNDESVKTPLHFFCQLLPDELVDIIAKEATRYVSQSGEPNFTTSMEEIKKFLAINLIMTYIRYPNYRMYWSSLTSLRMDLIADTLPLKRFEKLKRYLHFIDNTSIPKENKRYIYKN